jgi:hypothetical protein
MQPSAPNAEFWQWFRANDDRLKAAMYGEDADAREAASAELREAVNTVAPELILEFGQGGEGEPDQLVVSADGRPERVDAVKDFVASAPAIPGWEVVAFRPRMEIGGEVEIVIQGERIAPADVWFSIEDDGGGLGLKLYVRDLTDKNSKMRGLGATLLAEHAMGERDAVTLLNSLQIEPLPNDPTTEGLQPFSELVAVIDEAREQMFPPPGSLPLEPEGAWQGLRGTISGSDAMILLNVGLQPFAGHPSYDTCLTVSLALNDPNDAGLPATEEEYLAVSGLGDRIGEALEAGQESLLAMTLMTQGRRDLIFYTSNAEAAIMRVEPWQTGEQSHTVETSLERDTFWGMYRSFCDAGAEGESEDETEE